MKTLSLCITYYDGDAHFLDRTLSFFQLQTCPPDEIILSSSGLQNDKLKKENTIKVANKNIPIKQINTVNRKLHGFPRNQGASFCNSDHIMFFDVDDIPHSQKIEITKYIINKYNCDAVVHNYAIGHLNDFSTQLDITYSKDIDYPTIIEKDRNSTNLICGTNPIHHGHITVRPEIVNRIKYNENRSLGEDGQFCQAVFDAGHTIKYCPHKLMYYRVK